MPAPATVSAQNINSEIGYTSTQSVNLNETRVRNLACDASGETNFAFCRWGINWRGGSATGFAFSKQYDTTSALNAYATDFVFSPATATSACALILFASGTMRVRITQGGVSTTWDSTWLTSGVNSNYTAQLTVSSGAWTSGTTGTDLNLNTDRTWEIVTTRTTNGFSSSTVAGNIIIKDTDGFWGTLLTRPYSFTADAERSL